MIVLHPPQKLVYFSFPSKLNTMGVPKTSNPLITFFTFRIKDLIFSLPNIDP